MRRSKIDEDGPVAASIGRSNHGASLLEMQPIIGGNLRKMVLSNKIRKPLGSLLVNEMTTLNNRGAKAIAVGGKKQEARLTAKRSVSSL